MLGCVDLFQLYGSVVPRSLIAAVYGGALGFTLKWGSDHYDEFGWAKHYTHGGVWYHPYSLHVLGMVLGFSLVMRIQSASRTIHALPAIALTFCRRPPRPQLHTPGFGRARRRRTSPAQSGETR